MSSTGSSRINQADDPALHAKISSGFLDSKEGPGLAHFYNVRRSRLESINRLMVSLRRNSGPHHQELTLSNKRNLES